MKRLIIVFVFFCSTLTAGIPVQQEYHGPTEQLIKRESWHTIDIELRKIGVPYHLYPFFNQIATSEDWGHIGYHGANQDYRVYQDVIRFTLEEIVGIAIRPDFHFLRIPGDRDLNLETLTEFTDYWGSKVDNKNSIRAKQLLSMNYSIYSNYDMKGSCSVHLFIKDKSKTEVNYAKQLEPLFNDLGVPTQALKKLFALAHTKLDAEGGILLKISENSHLDDSTGEAYNFADEQSYPSKRGGYYYGRSLISNHFQRMMSEQYLHHKIDISPQLRLLINNRYTLNPYSYLQIERFDLYDPEIIVEYEAEMRDYIRRLEYDPIKVEKYLERLTELW